MVENVNNIELLAGWLNEDLKVKIHHSYGTDDFEFRINYELADLSDLVFFKNPLALCQDAADLIDGNNSDLTQPIAGRILTKRGYVLFEHFPGRYGFSAAFSLLSDDKYIELVGNESNFGLQAKKILGPGWSDPREDRFTKFELLRSKLDIDVADALEIVSSIKKELTMEQSSEPANAGGHMSDHFTWYQNGLSACGLILKKYRQ